MTALLADRARDAAVRPAARAPRVTVAIASYNSSAYLALALRSALAQTLEDIEVIVVDDASHDDSVAIARNFAAQDARVRVEALTTNLGPGGARNRALALARGDWFAVLDSDDLMHPDRLAMLVDAAERDGADLVADNLLIFQADGPTRARRLLGRARRKGPTDLTLEAFLRETRLLVTVANLGYLKPVIRRAALQAAGVAYDESLRIGEDEDFLKRLLQCGLQARIHPNLTYFYRKHSGSISHRLDPATVAAIAAREESFERAVVAPSPAVQRALSLRRRATENAAGFVALVEALKARHPLQALKIMAGRPGAALLLKLPITALIRRMVARLTPSRPDAAPDPRAVCVISRQRLVGSVNGSSAYLLSLVSALRQAGFVPHLLQPSPVVLGRWPMMALRPEMTVFESLSIRGAVRLGRWVLATDPRIWGEGARAVAARGLGRLRLPTAWLGARTAPYAVAAPWREADLIYVARHARPLAAAGVLADYAFQTRALPYALSPDAPTAVVMHDLFHARADAFAGKGAADSTAALDEAGERRLLGRADAVIAIQAAEAAWVRASLPRTTCLLAPMAVVPAAAPQPGEDDLFGFVGSNTAPNIIGLQWFFEAVWPRVLAARPLARLQVVGSAARGLTGLLPRGVETLGVIADLKPVYARVGVVVSPLTLGSGLKIKLVESLAAGKAVVATSVTLQGLGPEAANVVRRADAAERFAEAAVGLAADPAARARLGDAALQFARAHFSPAACYEETIAWFRSGGAALSPAAVVSPNVDLHLERLSG